MTIKPKETNDDLLIMCITDEPLPSIMTALPKNTLPTTTLTGDPQFVFTGKNSLQVIKEK